MAEAVMEHIHEDLELLKQDIAVIKHILIEEGQLTDEAERRLQIARTTPLSQYTKLWSLCGKLLYHQMYIISWQNLIHN